MDSPALESIELLGSIDTAKKVLAFPGQSSLLFLNKTLLAVKVEGQVYRRRCEFTRRQGEAFFRFEAQLPHHSVDDAEFTVRLAEAFGLTIETIRREIVDDD